MKHFHSNAMLGKRFLGYEQHSNITTLDQTFSFQLNVIGKRFLGMEQHHSNTIKMETFSIPTQPVRQRVLSFQLNFRN